MKKRCSQVRDLLSFGCVAALMSSAARADVVALGVNFFDVESTWAWNSGTDGNGDDNYIWWQVTANGANQRVVEARSGLPESGNYAYAHIIANFNLNSDPSVPLSISASRITLGYVASNSTHLWDMASVSCGTQNTADFRITGGYYIYNGPVPISSMGKLIQPGEVVGPGFCTATGFSIPDASVKVYRGQSVQDGPHYASIEFRFTPLCPSDVNHDTYVNGDDFDSFMEWFDAGDDRADYDGNGWVNGDDFDLFTADFDQGC